MIFGRLAALACVVLLGAACSPSSPQLPSATNPAAVADRVTGTRGAEFLGQITTFEWPDDGRRAAESLGWISRDATSPDPETAKRAGTTARAIAGFLAGHYDDVARAGATNPALIQAYATALTPYLGAMVGEPDGTMGFEPLDPLPGNMEATARVFAVMAPSAPDFARAAAQRGTGYEGRFATYAAANPTVPIPDPQLAILMEAARLRGLIEVGAKLSGTQPDPVTLQTSYGLQYDIVSRMVRVGDPVVSPDFFDAGGALKPVGELDGGFWSRYNGQLAGYLAAYPILDLAVRDYQDTLSAIARP